MEVPYVVYTEPSNLAVDVDPQAELKLYFNHDLNPASVTTATVYLLSVNDQQPVRGSVTYRQRLITFKAAAPLLPGAYRLTCLGGNTGVKDVLGEPLPKDFVLQFDVSSTITIPAPQIIAPVDQSLVAAPPTLTWQAVPEIKRYQVQLSLAPDFNVVAWPQPGEMMNFVYAADGQAVSVVPGVDLPDGYYYFRVCGEGGPWSLPVGFALKKSLSETPGQAVSGLVFVGADPELFAVNVTGREISLHFDRSLDATSVTPKTVYVIKKPL